MTVLQVTVLQVKVCYGLLSVENACENAIVPLMKICYVLKSVENACETATVLLWSTQLVRL